MRTTHALVQVAAALLTQPDDRHWGYDLSRRSGVRSGVLYPILTRLEEQHWVTADWETADEARGRRARRYFQLTDLGRRELGAIMVSAKVDRRFTPVLGWA
jgi:PadR family transcriptional regulator PadR